MWMFPSKGITTETYVTSLKQIFKIRVPKQIQSDRNSAFTYSLFRSFLQKYNVIYCLASHEHTEKFDLKMMLRISLDLFVSSTLSTSYVYDACHYDALKELPMTAASGLIDLSMSSAYVWLSI